MERKRDAGRKKRRMERKRDAGREKKEKWREREREGGGRTEGRVRNC